MNNRMDVFLNVFVPSSMILYVIQWVLEECDEEHQNLDPRELDIYTLRDMIESAMVAWQAGAR